MTVDDFIEALNDCKKKYEEFGKYIICIDASKDDDIYPNLKEPKLYINTDIGQVEIFYDTNESSKI
jgi:hypothetical protein